MNSTSIPEEQLVSAFQLGHKVAFTTLYDTYSPALFGVVLRLVNDQEKAKDLLQDTFIKIWTHRSIYDPEQGRLFTWMVRIARNVALDELRSCKVQAQYLAYSYETTSVNMDFTSMQGLSTGSVFSLVPAKYRQLVELVYIQQWTHLEAAQALNLPLGTVKTHLRIALKELKLFFHQDIVHYQAH